MFMGQPIESIQNHFEPYKVKLSESIGGNGDNDIGLARGKYQNSNAFIKCFSSYPNKELFFTRCVNIKRERTAFSFLQSVDKQPESKTQIGYDNVSRAYVSFKYLNNDCFVYSYDGDITLKDYLGIISSDNIPMIKTIITDILKGIVYLQYAHIVHNDINLENVVISFPYPNDRTKPKATIIDFDFASQIKYKNGKVIPISDDIGTLKYISPEVFARINADPNKKDVWAAGITLFYMLKRKFLLSNGDEVSFAKNIYKTLTSGIPEKFFVFTKNQNRHPEMSLVAEALKAMLTPKPARRPSARECLEIIEGSGSSSKTQITSPQRTFSKTEIFNTHAPNN
jgi:serine/threonine protein kinase